MNRVFWEGPSFCAVTEDGQLVEYLETDAGDQAGDLILGRVDRLMPGLDCAFLKIGRKRDGFLPLREDSRSFTGGRIRSGDAVLVQIKKEETGQKGCYLTRDVLVPGQLLILMPMNRYIGVSSRIEEPEIRERLKALGREIAGEDFGLILRKAAAEGDPGDIRREAEELLSRWQEIQARSLTETVPGAVLYHGSPIDQLRNDYLARGGGEVQQAESLPADLLRQLREASLRKLSLPGGGTVVIDRCEAMTVIDVNTASMQGAPDKRHTVLRTNLEACAVIARQVRLRNLAGILLIDFIDMAESEDLEQVAAALESAFAPDRVKTVLHGWTSLGLMEMTRRRSRIERN